jgi:hypothetical protein
VQLSNVPEVRPARRLLVLATLIFVALFVLNVVTTVLSFHRDEAGRWFDLLRLGGNLVVVVLIWKGFVALAMLAERAAIYKQALDEELPRLRAAVADRSAANAGPADGALDPPDPELSSSPTGAPRPDA